jgi:hypothetical protein
VQGTALEPNNLVEIVIGPPNPSSTLRRMARRAGRADAARLSSRHIAQINPTLAMTNRFSRLPMGARWHGIRQRRGWFAYFENALSQEVYFV